ncbi:MAG TPA: thermonuclease family protein [Deltaproteobacteria bacterium]|jgi:endonuclease YncB( thermonuclease family)|nr:thermonuclease family protein [Deltaproteobacteria bacterium]HQJ09688.1 thermonuclease family protein [Deltaproteobacteria bacterium]
MKASLALPAAAAMLIVLMAVFHCVKHTGLHEVVWVYDGDTIRIDDGRKIRLIGVDAPEVESPYTKEEPYGSLSRKHLNTLLTGKKVFIKVGEEPSDRFGRTLAYVYADDILVNGRMIRDGWARVYMKFDYEYKELFAAYEREARAKGLGIWGSTERGFGSGFRGSE